jgi:dienelactone hydrolase
MQWAAVHAAAPPDTADYVAQGVQIIHKLAAADYVAVTRSFEPQLRKDLSQAKLSSQWKEFVTQVGSFVEVRENFERPEFSAYHIVVITCAFQKSSAKDVLVTFDKAGHVAGLYFGPQPTDSADQWTTPSYALPSLFRETPVTVEASPWHLPGTITLPKGIGPFPAVVLVPGTPPVDQDSTFGPNKIFKDLAWGLANRGIAVLRYTKRTHQFGAGLGGGAMSSFSLSEELRDDARAAVSLLAARSDVDHRQTYLLGHSLGGLAVASVATGDPRVAGIIMMGTPPGDVVSVLLERAEDGARSGGEHGAELAKAIPVLEKVREGRLPNDTIVTLFGERSLAGYWEDVRSHAAGAAAAKLSIPVMVLMAGHDGQAPPSGFESWQQALAGHRKATLKFYPALFHLFLPSTSTQQGEAPEDWSRQGNVSEEVVMDITSWVLSKEKG